MLKFTARLITPKRARPWLWRPSSTMDKKRCAAAGHVSWPARQLSIVFCSTRIRDCRSAHFADASDNSLGRATTARRLKGSGRAVTYGRSYLEELGASKPTRENVDCSDRSADVAWLLRAALSRESSAGPVPPERASARSIPQQMSAISMKMRARLRIGRSPHTRTGEPVGTFPLN
jgi:hypothetical protein